MLLSNVTCPIMTSSSRDNVWSDCIGLRNNNRNRFVYFNEDLYPSPDLLDTILCVLCHSLFFGQLSCMYLYFRRAWEKLLVFLKWRKLSQSGLMLTKVNIVLIFSYGLFRDTFYGLSQQEAEVEVDQKNLPYPYLIHVIFPWYNLRKIIISGL